MTKKSQEAKITDTILAYKDTFNSEQGKKVLYDLMKVCHLLQPSYVGGTPEETAFREGERSVVLRILTQLETDAEKLIEFIKQSKAQESSYEVI